MMDSQVMAQLMAQVAQVNNILLSPSSCIRKRGPFKINFLIFGSDVGESFSGKCTPKKSAKRKSEYIDSILKKLLDLCFSWVLPLTLGIL